MTNYIDYISDDELTDWMVDYLKAVNWQNASIGELDNVKEIEVERGDNANAIVTLYFHANDQSHLDEYALPEDMEGFNPEPTRTTLSFEVNAFDITNCGISEDDIFDTVYGGDDLHEDFRKYWCDKMYHALTKPNRDKFLQDLMHYNAQLVKDEENEPLENQLTLFDDTCEPAL